MVEDGVLLEDVAAVGSLVDGLGPLVVTTVSDVGGSVEAL